jgi:GMP synthase-like glutamine amidotransferase
MIVYVDLEHEAQRRDPARAARLLAQRERARQRFEALAGQPCLLLPYPQATPERLSQLGAQAVLVSGCSPEVEFADYAVADLAGLAAIYRAAAWPLLGFCAGHQLLAQAYGSTIGPMTGANGGSAEHGFLPVQLRGQHPLFAGVAGEPLVFQMHRWEVKAPPAGFAALAASPLCAVQALADDKRRLYGTQFHPEEYDDAHPAGRQVLENFFRLAGVLSP